MIPQEIQDKIKKGAEEFANGYHFGIYSEEGKAHVRGFEAGATEVINNPEKYGLSPLVVSDEESESDCRPLYEMYRTVIAAFAPYMIKEMAANCGKGNRTGKDGWLSKSLDKKFWMSELYYHCGKLQQALKEDNHELIKEHCADIANLALYTFDWKFNLLKQDVCKSTRMI